MKRINKIYIITECPYVGIFRAIVELSKELHKMGFDLNYIFPLQSRNRYGEQQIEHEKILSEYGNIIHVPLRRKFIYFLGDILFLRKYFKGNKTDIIISYTEYAGKVCRVLYLMKIIKNYYHAPQCIGVKRKIFLAKLVELFFEKFLSKSASYYLACGPSECYLLNKKYNISPEKIILAPNFRTFEKIEKSEKKYDFIYVGRMVKNKGIFELLESLKVLGMLRKIIVIGDGPELRRLKVLYPEVRFTGRIKPEDVFSFLSISKFFVSNSIIEGMPYTLIEAMSVGVVPFVSDVEGHRDLIINGYNGFLYDNQIDLMNLIFKTQLIHEKKYKELSNSSIKSSEILLKIAKESIKNNFKKYE